MGRTLTIYFRSLILQSPCDRMSDCIFCKIVNREVPNYTIYEDADVLAFLDINPHARGHAVVIPKSHIESVLDMSDTDLAQVIRGVTQVVTRIEKALQPDGYNIGWNDRKAAGQAVPHFHVHILPRWQGDGGGSMHSIIKNPDGQSVEEVAKLFA